MINNKEQMKMIHPQQPISRRQFWGFIIGIGYRKLVTSCWGSCGSYSSTHIKQYRCSYNAKIVGNNEIWCVYFININLFSLNILTWYNEQW